jgi:hypothetical protein
VEWPRGEATACKAVYTGSNPVSTSTRVQAKLFTRVQRAIGAVGARFLDTEEVTGSNPVSPTQQFRGRSRHTRERPLNRHGGRSEGLRPRGTEKHPAHGLGPVQQHRPELLAVHRLSDPRADEIDDLLQGDAYEAEANAG